MQFFLPVSPPMPYIGKRRLSVCMDRKASLRSTDTEGLRMIVISFLLRMFPQKSSSRQQPHRLQRRHMVRYHDIDAAIRHGRLRGKSKTAAFIWKIHKSHKKSFFQTSVFSRQAALPSTLSAGLFFSGQGQLLRNFSLPSPILFSRFFHCDTHTS